MLLTMQGHMGAGRAFSGTSLLPQVIIEHWNTNRKGKGIAVGPEAGLRVTFENILLV